MCALVLLNQFGSDRRLSDQIRTVWNILLVLVRMYKSTSTITLKEQNAAQTAQIAQLITALGARGGGDGGESVGGGRGRGNRGRRGSDAATVK